MHGINKVEKKRRSREQKKKNILNLSLDYIA